MSKKNSKIVVAGLLGAVALAGLPTLANSQLSTQDSNMGNNSLNQRADNIDAGLLAALSSHCKRSFAPWDNGNFFADAFGNGNWGRMI